MMIGSFSVFVKEWSNGVYDSTIDRLDAGILVFQSDTNSIEKDALTLTDQVARFAHVERSHD